MQERQTRREARESRIRALRPDRYDLILEAACREFARHGFQGASIESIAEAVGVGKGTIYNYVRSKEELFLAALRRTVRALVAFLHERVPADAPPIERMPAYLRAHIEYMQSRDDDYMLAAAAFYGTNFLYGRGAADTQAAVQAYEDVFRLLDGLCREWMGDDAFLRRGGRTLSFQILSLIDGAQVYAAAFPDHQPDPAVEAARILDLLQSGLGIPRR